MLANPSTSLIYETCTFTISNSGGGYIAFCFSANPEVSQRIENFCHNYGVAKEIHRLDDRYLYALTPLHRLKTALLSLFRAEIIHEKPLSICYEVVTVENESEFRQDVIWNEDEVEFLAIERFDEFWSGIIWDNLLEYGGKEMNGDQYGMGSLKKITNYNQPIPLLYE